MGVLGVDHIAFGTHDPEGLRVFYPDLTSGEKLEGAHGPVPVGGRLLVFFSTASDGPVCDEPEELAFDVDPAGFDEVLARGERLECVTSQLVFHTPWSKGFPVRDPDGRPIEFVSDDHGVYRRE